MSIWVWVVCLLCRVPLCVPVSDIDEADSGLICEDCCRDTLPPDAFQMLRESGEGKTAFKKRSESINEVE